MPTYGRHSVLIDSLEGLLRLPHRAGEILVIDQTPDHPEEIVKALETWNGSGAIRWIRLPQPSITAAMNAARREARFDVVLFLDDDIVPDENLIVSHWRAQTSGCVRLVAGRVLQPWHGGCADGDGSPFLFNHLASRSVTEFMGGNFSIDRREAIALGGFDENFLHVAYRFEAEFALRWVRSGRSIAYEAGALIHHLKASGGGTRKFGDYMRTWRPTHSVGEYYFLLGSRPEDWFTRVATRLLRAPLTRHHLRRPWWIPPTVVSECWGLLRAIRLVRQGPRLVSGDTN